jgi:hypothetical protein
MKGRSRGDDEESLVDRFDQLVESLREWASSELNLLKAKAAFSVEAGLVVFAASLLAIVACGLALVYLSLTAVIILTPHIGLAGAYGTVTGLFVAIAIIFGALAYRALIKITAKPTNAKGALRI